MKQLLQIYVKINCEFIILFLSLNLNYSKGNILALSCSYKIALCHLNLCAPAYTLEMKHCYQLDKWSVQIEVFLVNRFYSFRGVNIINFSIGRNK